MILFSVCVPCNEIAMYDGSRAFGDFDRCPTCRDLMDVWTESGVRNEDARRRLAGVALLGLSRTEPAANIEPR